MNETNLIIIGSRQIIYRRNLPHIQPLGATFFVTYNLKGALPKEVRIELTETYKRMKSAEWSKRSVWVEHAKHHFTKLDQVLAKTKSSFYINNPRLYKIIRDSLHFWDTIKIDLIAYCIMPNHVHVVLQTLEKDREGNPVFLNQVMESIKKYSARKCNEILKRKGQFWNRESYDRVIRDEREWFDTINYVLLNPVNAGFCNHPFEWKWTYLKEEYKIMFEL